MEIAIFLYEGMTALDAIGPYEVLNHLPDTTIKMVGKTKGMIRTDTGYLALNVDYTFDDVPSPDIILLPGATASTRLVMRDPDVIAWVQQAHKTTMWTTSVCTGSLILGAAGLLNGISATTHWATLGYLSQLGATPSKQRVVREGKIVTAAGVSAGIDMALMLASEIAGEDVARQLQLAIEYDPQPPFACADPSDMTSPIVQQTAVMLGTEHQAWLDKHT